ncbi:hypothetical protein HK101_009626 [Irineochytrium annulatum]|nr:hypothetical protein HK101_009626 [Irineochytrium annulatum]
MRDALQGDGAVEVVEDVDDDEDQEDAGDGVDEEIAKIGRGTLQESEGVEFVNVPDSRERWERDHGVGPIDEARASPDHSRQYMSLTFWDELPSLTHVLPHTDHYWAQMGTNGMSWDALEHAPAASIHSRDGTKEGEEDTVKPNDLSTRVATTTPDGSAGDTATSKHHHHHHHHHHTAEAKDLDNHFTNEEFGEAKIKLYDKMCEDSTEKLFCRARPLQYFVGDVLHREKTPRKVNWDELFLDLIFVATIARCESFLKVPVVTWDELNKFCLVFAPVWQHWLYTHNHSNRFAAYDLYHKVYTWIMMILNAGMGINAQNAFSEGDQNTGNLFIITFLLGRLFYILSHSRIYWSAPEFSFAVSITLVISLIGTAPYLASVFLADAYRPALWWSGFLVELAAQNLLILVFRHYIPKRFMKYRLALNIEHHSERFGLLTLMVLGEVVVAILWDSSSPTFSWNYLATVLGLMMAISMEWIYYNVDGSRQYTHALRRSVPSAVMWQMFHFPLHVSAVAAGACLSMIISLSITEPWSPPDPGLRWVFAGGFSVSMIFIALIGLTHKSHEQQARFATKMAKKARIGGRLLVAMCLMVLAAAGGKIGATGLLMIAAVVMVTETVVEEWGRLKVARPPEEGKGKGKEIKRAAGDKAVDSEEAKAESSDTLAQAPAVPAST